ncbi:MULTISPECIES: STAS domain-containing protein [Streptomyces]|uniref:STAS domain-containing protein n=1 Tax=Streptomyces TaxID=1883 RepID=UPI0009E7242B|nr:MULTISPECIES: STAS domain-containing protein [Streptomyces]MYT03785.1 anti-sigma factor antagonist [Streptomyces sp. SID5470]
MSEKRTRPAPPISVRTSDGTTVVTLYGEIDLVTAIPLASGLDALSSGPHPDLVLDLRPVSFIDCSGLSVLCRTWNRVRARQGRLRLVTEDGGFLRVLRAAGLGGVFEVGTHLAPPGAERPCSRPGTGPERPRDAVFSAHVTVRPGLPPSRE